MKLSSATKIAMTLMKEHGLLTQGWKFTYDRAVRRFGLCSYKEKTISLSKHLVELNDEKQMIDTMLHEIAHALVGKGHGHNRTWQRQAVSIGCSGTRCYGREVVRPKAKYSLTCPNCSRVTTRSKLCSGLACGACCRQYNGGKYSAAYQFIVN
jgi:predicted SprT family Zn-dependent metalloprotease